MRCAFCKWYVPRPWKDFDGYCTKNETSVTDIAVCRCFDKKPHKQQAI